MWLLIDFCLGYFLINSPIAHRMVYAGILVNLIMFALNLFPLPPLDGGRIFTSLLPAQLAIPFSKIESYGFIIVVALVWLGWMEYWLTPVSSIALQFLQILIYPLRFL